MAKPKLINIIFIGLLILGALIISGNFPFAVTGVSLVSASGEGFLGQSGRAMLVDYTITGTGDKILVAQVEKGIQVGEGQLSTQVKIYASKTDERCVYPVIQKPVVTVSQYVLRSGEYGVGVLESQDAKGNQQIAQNCNIGGKVQFSTYVETWPHLKEGGFALNPADYYNARYFCVIKRSDLTGYENTDVRNEFFQLKTKFTVEGKLGTALSDNLEIKTNSFEVNNVLSQDRSFDIKDSSGTLVGTGEYLGSASFSQICPSSAKINFVYEQGANKLYTINQDSDTIFNSYKSSESSITSRAQSCRNQYPPQQIDNVYESANLNGYMLCLSQQVVQPLSTNYNTVKNALNKVPSDFIGYKIENINEPEASGSIGSLTIPFANQYAPRFSIKLDADWVGVEFPSSSFDFAGACEVQATKTAAPFTITCPIKNTGNTAGTAIFGLNSNCPVVKSSGGSLWLDKGQTNDGTIVYTGTAVVDTDCYVELKSLDSPEKGTKTQKVHIKLEDVCQLTQKDCLINEELDFAACKCVCTLTETDCKYGVDLATCKCKESDLEGYCGDGYCSESERAKYFELFGSTLWKISGTTCPQDCSDYAEPSSDWSILAWILGIIFGIIVLLIVLPPLWKWIKKTFKIR